MKTKNLRIQTTQTLQNETAQFVFWVFWGFSFFFAQFEAIYPRFQSHDLKALLCHHTRCLCE